MPSVVVAADGGGVVGLFVVSSTISCTLATTGEAKDTDCVDLSGDGFILLVVLVGVLVVGLESVLAFLVLGSPVGVLLVANLEGLLVVLDGDVALGEFVPDLLEVELLVDGDDVFVGEEEERLDFIPSA